MHHGFWDKNTKAQAHTDSLNNMNRVLAERVMVKSGDKILDAGCGVGASSIWLAKEYDVSVIGITLSELQCQKANDFAEREGVSGRVKFYVQDFTETDFPNETFDIVWAIESVCHAADKKAFIEETARILKRKGGKLIIADGFTKENESGKLGQFLLNNWLERWAIDNLAKGGEFKKWLQEDNFRKIDFWDVTKNVLPSSKEIFKRGVLGWPSYKLERRNPVQVNHVEGCIFQYLALKSGAWIYGIFYAEN